MPNNPLYNVLLLWAPRHDHDIRSWRFSTRGVPMGRTQLIESEEKCRPAAGSGS